MVGPRKRQVSNLQRDKHEATVLKHLYEEGPSTTEELQEVLGLSRARTSALLTHIRAGGSIGYSYLREGAPYWLLAEDMVDA